MFPKRKRQIEIPIKRADLIWKLQKKKQKEVVLCYSMQMVDSSDFH